MHSWIFRNRERLRVLFGLELPASPAPILQGVAEALEAAGVEESSSPRAVPNKAGTIRRTARYVVIEPMPPLENAG